MVIRKSKAEIRAQRRLGTTLMIIGFLLVAGALSLVMYNRWDSDRAGEEADAILQQIDRMQSDMVPGNPPPSIRSEAEKEVDERVLAAESQMFSIHGENNDLSGGSHSGADGNVGMTAGIAGITSGPGTAPAGNDANGDKNSGVNAFTGNGVSGADWLTSKPMPTLDIDGYKYIGTLEIPSLGIRLPVMDTWDYTRLKVSPCLYSGNYFLDDMVICGHNYARHFSPIKWVDIGADVFFTTADMVVYHYTVSNRETVQPTSIEKMIQNQNNSGRTGLYMQDWDLTLFTCNTGGQTRCAVRCIRADENKQ